MTAFFLSIGLHLEQGRSEPAGPVLPLAEYGLITATKDGSTGQTYTLSGSWSDLQWYRMTVTAPFGLTAIEGATSASYVAQASDEGYRLVVMGMDGTVMKAAKSYQVVAPSPLLLESFDNASGFVATAGAVLTNDTLNKVQGSAALNLAATGTTNAKAEKADIGTFDPATFGTIAQFFDLGSDPVYQCAVSIKHVLTRGGVEYGGSTQTLYQTPAPLFYGSFWDSWHVSEIAGLAALGSGQLGIANSVSMVAPNAATVKVDALLAKAGGRATVVIGFDDIRDSQYTIAFPLLEARGLKAGFHLVSANVGQAGRLTLAQMQEMYAAGWDCNLNGSTDDGAMTSKGTLAAALASLQEGKAYAISAGMPRGNEHICYPNGTYQVNGAKLLVTSVTSTGTGIVTMTSTTGILAGMVVAGYQVPAGTTVVSIDSTTQITLTNNIPAQTKPMSFTVTSGEFSGTKLPNALAAAGYRTARTTINRGSLLTRFGFGGRGLYMPGTGLSAYTLEAAKALVDTAILRGETLEFYIHGLTDSGGIDTSPAVFTALVDYLQAQRDMGLLDVMTKSELWARDGGSSVPV